MPLPPEQHRLRGKVAIVTGSASGIGQGCARMFAEEGAAVISIDRDEGDFTCDLTDPEAVRSAFDAISTDHHKIDILVNAAAFAIFSWIDEMSFEDWRRTLSGELDIVFLATKAAWPLLKASGRGSIINFASANAYHALNGSAALAHCSGKGGVLAMTRQLAMEGAPHGVRANTISPGFIQTAATKRHLDAVEGFREQVLAKNMIKRLGTPEDIAYCATWLASDEATYVTAADIRVDAGATAW